MFLHTKALPRYPQTAPCKRLKHIGRWDSKIQHNTSKLLKRVRKYWQTATNLQEVFKTGQNGAEQLASAPKSVLAVHAPHRRECSKPDAAVEIASFRKSSSKAANSFPGRHQCMRVKTTGIIQPWTNSGRAGFILIFPCLLHIAEDRLIRNLMSDTSKPVAARALSDTLGYLVLLWP